MEKVSVKFLGAVITSGRCIQAGLWGPAGLDSNWAMEGVLTSRERVKHERRARTQPQDYRR